MPTATYTPLATITLGSAESSVTFSSIPQTYRDLILVITGTVTSGDKDVKCNLNGDSADGNYSRVVMSGDGSSTYSLTGGPRNLTYYGFLGSQIATVITNFMDYSATDKHKTYLSRANRANSGVDAVASRFASTSAITSMELTSSAGTFASGSSFSLYGIEA